jgi:hypothetical protein
MSYFYGKGLNLGKGPILMPTSVPAPGDPVDPGGQTGTAKKGGAAGTFMEGTGKGLNSCQQNCNDSYKMNSVSWKKCMNACNAQTDGPAEGEGDSGEAYPGCPDRGKKYMLGTGAACDSGYVPVQKPEGIQCECVKWCQDTGYGADCMSGGTSAGKLGEFKWPAEMDDYYNALIGRGREALEKKPGFSDTMRALMFGQGVDKMRKGEGAIADSRTSALGAAGLLGTGAGNAAMVQPQLEREQNVGNLLREVLLANEGQKRTDYNDWTGIADKLFGTGMQYNQTKEILNASRRGEGRDWTKMYLDYLKSMLSSYGA